MHTVIWYQEFLLNTNNWDSSKFCHVKLGWTWSNSNEAVLQITVIRASTSQSPVGWGYRIHWLYLCRGVMASLLSVLDMSLNNLIEGSVMLDLWGMWSTPLLPSLPDPLWPRVVAPDRVLSMGQIELFDF